jgi:CRP-like cAMP-binding protein
MTTSIDGNMLAYIPLFADLSEVELAELSRLLKPRHFAPGQHIVWAGESGKEFFVIEQGRVNILLPDQLGRELVLATLGPGQFFGEISLLDGGPRTATARAETDASLMELSRDEFLEFIRRHPTVAIRIMTVLGQRQRETNEKLRGIKNANEVIAETSTPGQKAVERIAMILSSTLWVIANLIVFASWIISNVVLRHTGHKPFDSPPMFPTLAFLITLEAILLSMFVLSSQRRQADRDRIRSDLEYQVNIKAHLEVMQLHQKIDRMEAALAKSAEAS